MSISDLLWLVALVITHAIAYMLGKTESPEPFRPTNEAWVAVQCHSIDKQYEYIKWLRENGHIEKITGSGD